MSNLEIPPPPQGSEQPEAGYLDEDDGAAESAHWQDYWANDILGESGGGFRDVPEVSQLLLKEQNALLGAVATGHELKLKGNLEDIHTPGEAAYELYLQLGPNNEMQGGEQMLVALAGRVYNEAVGSEVVSGESYYNEFFNTDPESSRAAPEGKTKASSTTIKLLSELNPFEESPEARSALNERLNSADPAELTKVMDMLADAARATDNPSLRTPIRDSAQLLISHIEQRADTEPADILTVTNHKYDIKFAQMSESGAKLEEYQKLIPEYLRDSTDVLHDSRSHIGHGFEVFVPMLARYESYDEAYAQGTHTLNAVQIEHAAQRTDAPHEYRKPGSRKTSSDIKVTDMESGEVGLIQLKADRRDHRLEYDPGTIEVFDGGIRQIVEEFVTDDEVREQLYGSEGNAYFDKFVASLMRATSEYMLKAELTGQLPKTSELAGAAELNEHFNIPPQQLGAIVSRLREINYDYLTHGAEDNTGANGASDSQSPQLAGVS